MTNIDDSTQTPPGYWFGEIEGLLHERMRDALADLGLRRGSWRILHTLAEGPATAEQLAERLPHGGPHGDRACRDGRGGPDGRDSRPQHDERRGYGFRPGWRGQEPRDERDVAAGDTRRDGYRGEGDGHRHGVDQPHPDHHEGDPQGSNRHDRDHDHDHDHERDHERGHRHGGHHHPHGFEEAVERGYLRGFDRGFTLGTLRAGQPAGPFGPHPYGGFPVGAHGGFAGAHGFPGAYGGPAGPAGYGYVYAYGPFGPRRPGRPFDRRFGGFDRDRRRGHRIQRVLSDFVERGWVWFDGDSATLTDEGRAAHDRAFERVATVRAELANGITEADYATTMATLERMARNLGWRPARSQNPGTGEAVSPDDAPGSAPDGAA
ncbi:hypothetical protein [Leifsonia sp. 22587]|uniref:hypothetical protein n=1 Tax=Leifsonia sp. 22587 TaxID=3453946 RepID=UPI003F83EB68